MRVTFRCFCYWKHLCARQHPRCQTSIAKTRNNVGALPITLRIGTSAKRCCVSQLNGIVWQRAKSGRTTPKGQCAYHEIDGPPDAAAILRPRQRWGKPSDRSHEPEPSLVRDQEGASHAGSSVPLIPSFRRGAGGGSSAKKKGPCRGGPWKDFQVIGTNTVLDAQLCLLTVTTM
jgi:hypothetical protein